LESSNKTKCQCLNITCEKHGNCKECNAKHKGGKQSYCNLKQGSFRKWMMDKYHGSKVKKVTNQ